MSGRNAGKRLGEDEIEVIGPSGCGDAPPDEAAGVSSASTRTGSALASLRSTEAAYPGAPGSPAASAVAVLLQVVDEVVARVS
jgi:hypothetical protein